MDPGHLAQHLIPRLVPMDVVDLLEEVDVPHGHGVGRALARVLDQHALENKIAAAAVVQFCQGIGPHLVFDEPLQHHRKAPHLPELILPLEDAGIEAGGHVPAGDLAQPRSCGASQRCVRRKSSSRPRPPR